ncbi:MAG: MarR family winged helix-turn-helix transcriptional regulator [Tabrizicola sp.]|jgi:DNA-binding MarR family transcriptional regulator|nr:MarR family winged helix-turn-helix transcriptional regulator [Tabrizicola sp.]
MNLTSPATCLTHGLMRTARAVARGFEAEAASLGVTAPQFTVLARLSFMGPMTVTQIAAVVDTDRTTMSRNLAVMAERGWITQARADDRRERVWQLADDGRSTLAAVMPVWQAWQARLVERLGPETAEHLLTTLKTLATD